MSLSYLDCSSFLKIVLQIQWALTADLESSNEKMVEHALLLYIIKTGFQVRFVPIYVLQP